MLEMVCWRWWIDRIRNFAAPDLVADVIFDFAAVVPLRDDVFVDVADPQMRNLLVV
jgi:hypothetical protein